jgi:hypothetical protein
MDNVTLSNLRTRARDKADMADSNFISDSELDSYINVYGAELYDLLVSRFEDYYTVKTTVTVLNGSDKVALPSDFYKLRGVDVNSGGTYTEVPRFNFQQRNAMNGGYRRLSPSAPFLAYRIIKNDLVFVPADNASYEYRLWYIPRYTKLSADTDVLDGVNGWDEYIVVCSAMAMLAKEESDVSYLMAEKKALIDRIEAMANNRDVDAPERITEITYPSFIDPLFRI